MVQPQTLRQIFVITGLVLCSVSDGYIFGQMSGMVSDLQSEDSSIPLTDSDVSWIASAINATCICGFVFTALITEKVGRKKAITILSAPIVANWVLVYYAETIIVFIASRIIVGMCFGGVIMLIFITAGEYVSPKLRGFTLNMISSVGPSIGTALGHILGILLHWRTVALIGIIPSALSALFPCFWVESPSWLASKGRFEECEISFRVLHDDSDAAKNELQLLVEIENCKRNKLLKSGNEPTRIEKFKTMIVQRHFWNLMLMGTVIGFYRAVAGRIVFSTLAITILKDTTGSNDILFFTILVDGFIILGSCMSCVLISKMKMRSLLFPTAIIANIFLITLSALLYYKPDNYIYFPWIISTVLALYFVTIFSGPYPVLEALVGEIFPLEIKSYCIFFVGSMNAIFIFLSVKLAGDLFTLMGYHGVFFLNAILMFLCLIYFWIYMPETKGRTLQEIELYFKNNRFENIDELLKGEQIKALV